MTEPNHRFNRRRLLKASGAAGILATTQITSVAPALADQSTPTPLPSAVKSTITEMMRAKQIPGASILIEREGSAPWKQGFGVSDLETGTPMLSNMHMRVGSITKTMTATAVLQLVDEGLLSLDDTLASVMPEISAFPNGKSMTIRQMLNMRSGAFNYLEDESIFMQMVTDPTRPWTPDELIDINLLHEPYFDPGEGFHYSNTNYILLGMIVEQLAHQSLAEFLDERVFAPLGMMHTSLPDDVQLPAPFARGYGIEIAPTSATPAANGADGLKDWTKIHPTMAGASGGIVSTVGDLAVWLHELVDGTLLSETMQEERMTFTPVEGGPGFSYGLGIADFGGMVGHDGSIFGYQGFAARDRETGTSIVVLINVSPSPTDASAAALAMAIREALGEAT
ncbi:MAG TPA: serine hydrolase domain-containing protein [Thermomicrobiales bacterium]|nr:serine hydrolase domain-containing protein [Thermomicrobiales bacterium]